jgi:hypothetical protein
MRDDAEGVRHAENSDRSARTWPLLIAPSILMKLGEGASSDLTGNAAVTNSPCISSLSLSGRAIADAFSVSDAANEASLIVLPVAGLEQFQFQLPIRFNRTQLRRGPWARRADHKLLAVLRRSAVRNMVQAGVAPQIAKRLSGHKTDSMFQRYSIIVENDLRQAIRQTDEYRKKAVENVIPIAQSK